MAGEYDINLSDGSLLTTIYVREVNGGISTPRKVVAVDDVLDTFSIQGDLTARMQPGFIFNISNSNGGVNNGAFTVVSSTTAVDVNLGTLTVISVVESVAAGTSPFGQLFYSIPADTSLILPGRESINYGENIIEGMVRMMENFAGVGVADANAPANPLTGQLYFNSAEESFYHYDGAAWTNDLVVGDITIGGALSVVDGHFTGRVGINNPVPVGTVYLEVTGDIQANSQFRGSDQSAAAPTYTFTNDTTAGLFYVAGDVGVGVGGLEVARFTSTGITLNSTELFGLPATPSANDAAASKLYVDNEITTVSGDLTTHTSDASIHFTQAAISITASQVSDFNSAADARIALAVVDDLADVDTTTSPPTVGDTLVWDGSNWVPEGTSLVPQYEEFVAGISQTIFNTTIPTASNTSGGNSKLQVFVNGIYQLEGALKAYQVTGANQITFNAAVPDGADVVLYTF